MLPLHQELQHPVRRQLDSLVFDEIGLTRGERDGIYEAVIDLVETRLKKAASLSTKGRLARENAADRTRGIWAGLPAEEEEEEA